MSSGFVSAGTNEQPVARDDEWLEAQKEIEETRRRKAEESHQQEGKTLFETLQANKAAKQEAFEESIRLKNQFRTLDEDEVDFLDSVLESTRAQEAAVKRETTEQLELFRKQQEKADAAMVGVEVQDNSNLTTNPTANVESEQWTVGNRKRKKGRHDVPKVLKLRKTSTGEGGQDAKQEMTQSQTQLSTIQPTPTIAQNSIESVTGSPSTARDKETSLLKPTKPSTSSTAAVKPAKPAAKPAVKLGLGGYSSDEDE